jgi:preprotein translocase subunit SecE
MFEMYKPTQGKRTRWITFGAGCCLAVITGYWLSDRLATASWFTGNVEFLNTVLRYGLPLLVFVGVSSGMFVLINRPRTADFLIATEGEMKKVSWSSRREIIGSTKVVILTTLAMAVMLFLVDFLFSGLFRLLKVIS